ncbi:MAG TPA: NAD(P)-dependent oxidoreductase [Phycisphaerae bacterium]|jgi:D-3-phosphoglycerate dehydrogenase|nr:3-phosphoglycerate dehydrogenase [Phycisphaerae bacterium]HOB75814.1 NAD(P)-dependent oxidoreductase [Phycisphaerae bacterium]HOJ54559.1 NAD(P)-dependent oxidoreductase [Phycisphaerae bacterium]HOL27048.1 NAD(P)-dependent oxidoreductase [Phycisphaerae bacterium]HPP22154.1 NAD(P)-dependent oxidoreductase [Phycisphaerae bacterium]
MGTEPKPRIVLAEGVSDSALQRLQAAGEVVRLEKHDHATLLAAVPEADALLVRTYAQVNAEVIAAAAKTGRLKVIGRAGVGVDNIDVTAAKQAGIVVVNTPAASTIAVAELVVGLIVAVQRGFVFLDPRVRQGEFASLRAGIPKVTELHNQTLGVIGMGRIGRQVGARMHNGMGMRVVYYDIREIGWLPFPAQTCGSAEEVYAQADVVTMHVPLTRLTRGMINAATLAHFKPGAYLINASRGPVVEAQALADALREGRLAGAAIDVYDPEPPPPDHPLMTAPNCILTPHIASRTREAITAMNDVVDDVIGVLAGKPPMYPAEPEQV